MPRSVEEKVTAWCKDNGFQDLNTRKTTFRGATKFPLHTAVKHNNQEIIGMMLIVGAQKNVRDSKNHTPSELAASLNKNGSHNQAIAMLCGEMQCSEMGLLEERAVALDFLRRLARNSDMSAL
jgi:hypothetical protein